MQGDSEKTPDNANQPNQQSERTYILFAVWFRANKGAERYREYLENASPIAMKFGARRAEGLLPIEVLSGQFDPNYISIIEWPSIENYYNFLKDPHYRRIAQLRSEAVEKSVTIHCRRI